MSPERLREEQSDEKTDVFSFGVVLWEILTRKLAWEGLTSIQIVARVGYAAELLSIPEAPKGCPPGFISLIRDCWEPYTTKRPSFETALKQLREMLEKLS
jgi:serine/threonine-protein kinase CTR1